MSTSFCEARDWTLYGPPSISEVSAICFKKKLSVSNTVAWSVDNWKEYILFIDFSAYVSLDECKYFGLVMDSPLWWSSLL